MSDFYRAFEDRHRGSRELIKWRFGAYTPFLAPLPTIALPCLALDLGCGRGEWLELLGERRFTARGVDLDDGMLAACRERGLDVATEDALAALRAQPDASLALVSAFHLIEHIPFAAVQELITQAKRVLRPGGLLILETTTPENLVVGVSNFYADPSHLRPVPPLLLDFAVEFAGFARHKVVRLQDPAALHGAAHLELIHVLNGVSPDYGVVAQKPAELVISAAFDSAFATDFGLELATLAQRYEQQRESERSETHAHIARLSERIAAAENTASDLFQRALEATNEAHAAARHAQAELHAAQQREHALNAQLQHVTWQLNEMTVRARAAEQKVADLFASPSWRMIYPARAAMSLLRRPLGAANVARIIAARHKARASRMLMPLVRRLAQHPGARSLAMRILARFPALEGRVRSMTYRALHGAPAYVPPAATPSTTSAQPGQPQIANLADLTRSAQKVFAELQRTAASDDQQFH